MIQVIIMLKVCWKNWCHNFIIVIGRMIILLQVTLVFMLCQFWWYLHLQGTVILYYINAIAIIVICYLCGRKQIKYDGLIVKTYVVHLLCIFAIWKLMTINKIDMWWPNHLVYFTKYYAQWCCILVEFMYSSILIIVKNTFTCKCFYNGRDYKWVNLLISLLMFEKGSKQYLSSITILDFFFISWWNGYIDSQILVFRHSKYSNYSTFPVSFAII